MPPRISTAHHSSNKQVTMPWVMGTMSSWSSGEMTAREDPCHYVIVPLMIDF